MDKQGEAIMLKRYLICVFVGLCLCLMSGVPIAEGRDYRARYEKERDYRQYRREMRRQQFWQQHYDDQRLRRQLRIIDQYRWSVNRSRGGCYDLWLLREGIR